MLKKNRRRIEEESKKNRRRIRRIRRIRIRSMLKYGLTPRDLYKKVIWEKR